MAMSDRRDLGPALGLVRPTSAQPGEQRPGGGEDGEHRSGDDVLLGPGEGADDGEERSEGTANDGEGDDPADVASGSAAPGCRWLRWSPAWTRPGRGLWWWS